jgi:3-oxoacyl-[acyl-carrier-protein] synthase III
VASDRLRLDGDLRYALVVGTEVLSPFTDWSDVETAVYFSDGAGAAVLGRVPAGWGIRASAFHTDTANLESVRLRGGGSRFPYALGPGGGSQCSPGYQEMNGLATWKQAVTHLPATVRRACEMAAMPLAEVDLFVFHQANLHLIQYAAQKLRVPLERAFSNVQEIGNTGAASIPIALDQAVRTGLVQDGAKVVLAGVGAGFTFGASAWIWDTTPVTRGPLQARETS